MGMFDYVKCSANIGALTDIGCQTKTIEGIIDGTMSFYWVSPGGLMYIIDYSGTTDFVENTDSDDAPIWLHYHMVPNGNRGKVSPYLLSKDIVIYDSITQADGYVDWIFCKLEFMDGILQKFQYINNGIEK